MFRRLVHTASRPCCGVYLIPSTHAYPFGSSYQNHLYPQPLLDIFFWIYTSASWWSHIDHPSICVFPPHQGHTYTPTLTYTGLMWMICSELYALLWPKFWAQGCLILDMFLLSRCIPCNPSGSHFSDAQISRVLIKCNSFKLGFAKKYSSGNNFYSRIWSDVWSDFDLLSTWCLKSFRQNNSDWHLWISYIICFPFGTKPR